MVSTGIKVQGEGDRDKCKLGGSQCRVWRKIHFGIDEETSEIRAVEATSSNVGDGPVSALVKLRRRNDRPDERPLWAVRRT